MALRIPLSPDMTLQTEFHEIERRLRRLERNLGTGAGESHITVVAGSSGGGPQPAAAVDLSAIYARLDALEDTVATLDTASIPVFMPAGSSSAQGIVPDPGNAAAPVGLEEHLLKEDATWGFPLRGLVKVAKGTDDVTTLREVLDVLGGLHVAGDLTAADLEIFNLHTHGYVEYGDTFWDDLRFPATGFNPAGSTAPPAVLTTNGLLSFAGAVDNIIGGVAQMPHQWKEGTAIHPHIHLAFPTAATANTRWLFEYNIANVDGDFTTDTVTYTSLAVITVANANNVARHVMAEFADIPMTGKTVSACVLWRLSRLAFSDGADTDTNDCTLIEFDLHYERDSPGSRTELTK